MDHNTDPTQDSVSERTKKNNIVIIDGGIAREVSQIRQLVLQAALRLGYTGIKDLEEHSKNIKLKNEIRNAALADGNPSILSLAIPTTFTQSQYLKDMKKYALRKDTFQVFSEVKGEDRRDKEFERTVSFLGNSRAWLSSKKTKEQQKTPITINNRNIGCESKRYQGGYWYFGRGISKSKEAHDIYKELYHQSGTCYEIINDLIYVKKENDIWRECETLEEANNPDSIKISRRQLIKWKALNKTNPHIIDLPTWAKANPSLPWIKCTSNPTSFANYTSKQAATSGGKQKKAVGTGFYIKDGKKYYIKRSEKFQADDLAEIITSSLGRSILTKENKHLFAECTPIQAYKGAMFVRSTCAPGWKSLYEHNFGSNFLLDRLRPQKFKKTFNIVEKLENKQKIQLAKILAACLWLGEYDCGTQNIGKDHDRNIIKIDHGWGLASICKKQHAKVRLFEKKSWTGTRGIHKFTGLPTNHFNDFKYLIIDKNKFFITALTEIIANIKKQEKFGKPHTIVKAQLADIIANCASQNDQKSEINALMSFTNQIGLALDDTLSSDINAYLNSDTLTTPSDLLDKLTTTIADKLTARLIERRKSMEVVCVLLDSKIESKELEINQEIQMSIINTLINLKEKISKNYLNSEHDSVNIDDIMTEWSHGRLLKVFNQLNESLNNPNNNANVQILSDLPALIEYYKEICLLSHKHEYLKLLETIEKKVSTKQHIETRATSSSPLICKVKPGYPTTIISGKQLTDIDKLWNTLLVETVKREGVKTFGRELNNKNKIIFHAAKFTAEKMKNGDILLKSSEINAKDENIKKIVALTKNTVEIAAKNGKSRVPVTFYTGSLREISQVCNALSKDPNVQITLDNKIIKKFKKIAENPMDKEQAKAKVFLKKYSQFVSKTTPANPTLLQRANSIISTCEDANSSLSPSFISTGKPLIRHRRTEAMPPPTISHHSNPGRQPGMPPNS